MKQSLIVLLLLGLLCPAIHAAEKVRIVVLTDIENEPDDAQSMVRFLTYANQFDVEGLVATTSIHQQKRTAAARIRQIVEAYGKVQANLLLHEPNYPTAEHLKSVIREGRADYGMNAVGEGQDSSGSDLLIAAADRDDPRPQAHRRGAGLHRHGIPRGDFHAARARGPRRTGQGRAHARA